MISHLILIYIYIIGGTNNGKSSFINSLLNQDIVPEEENSSKVGFCEIINSKKEEIHITDNNDQTIILKRGENISQRDQILDYMSEYNDIEFKDVKIYCKFDLFGKYNNNVKIIDSPGFDIIKTQNVINNKINNKEDDIDIVIAVIKCQDKITDPMREYLKKLYSEKKTKHIFFVINHFHTNSRFNRNQKAKQRENEKKRIKEIEDSIKDISKESYDKKKFYVHHVCLYCTTTREDICPLENPVDEFNKFKSCLEKYVGLFNIYYKFESQILFFKDYIIKGESILRDIIKMHEKEKTELENKKEENEEQIYLLNKFIKKVSEDINNYINENEQKVKEDIKKIFSIFCKELKIFYQKNEKESQTSNMQKIIGTLIELLKNYYERNIKDIRGIYSKNISNFKHENKVMEEKVKNKLNNFYMENDNNMNVSILLNEILTSQLKYLSSKDSKSNSNLIKNAMNILIGSALTKIISVSKGVIVESKGVVEFKPILNKYIEKNIHILCGSACIGVLVSSCYYLKKRGAKEEKESKENQDALNKWINDIYEKRNLILKKFEKDYNNILKSEIKKLKDSNEQLNLEIINKKGIITNINKYIKILDNENTKLKEYFNNIVILVR